MMNEFNAGAIFDSLHEEFTIKIGVPRSAAFFCEQHIEMDVSNTADGLKQYNERYRDYWESLCEVQRESFIVGFNAALQLLTSSCSKNI